MTLQLENLNQFNKRLFKKYFGNYIKDKRKFLNLSEDELSSQIGIIDGKRLKSLESGSGAITQYELEHLISHLNLDEQELVQIAQLTQVQNLLDIYAEINENYP